MGGGKGGDEGTCHGSIVNQNINTVKTDFQLGSGQEG